MSCVLGVHIPVPLLVRGTSLPVWDAALTSLLLQIIFENTKWPTYYFWVIIKSATHNAYPAS